MTAEPQYSAKETARRLGVSSGMLRRYAMALETVTGETIRQHPRDGRQYTGAQVAALVQAKQLVGAKPGRDVETAVRMVLGLETDTQTSLPLALPNADPDFMRAVLEPLVTPLLTELQALRTSNERLLEEVVQLRQDAAERALPAPRTNREAELERTVGYLVSEFERRRLEGEQRVRRRPWWQLWDHKG